MKSRRFSMKIVALACVFGLVFGVCVSMALGNSLEAKIASDIEAMPKGTTTTMYYTYEVNP